MSFDEEYFKSEEFQQLLSSYENAQTSGNSLFLDADEFVDIADYYSMNGEADKADEAVERGLGLFPDDVLLNVFMTRKALNAGDYDEANRRADQIADKEAPDYHYLRAEILIAQGKIEDADRYLREYGKTVDTDEYLDFVKDVANLYIDYDVSRKAYEWMGQSVDDDSDDFKELMARTLFGLGKYKDSQRLFNELIDHNPFSTKYWTALASAQYMDEDYQGAVSSSEYAIAIDPQDPDGLLSKANGLMKLGNYEEAAEYFGRYYKCCPDDPVGPFNQGICLYNLQRSQEAVDLLSQSLALAEGDSDAIVQICQELAFAYSANGELDRALHALDRTDRLPCDHVDMLVLRGHLLLGHNRIEDAEAVFRKAMMTSNGDPIVVLRIIVSLLDNQFVVAAYEMFQRFFNQLVAEDYPNGHAYMALCCLEYDKREECLEHLQKALELNPSETRSVLAQVFPDDLPLNQYYEYMRQHFDELKKS